MPVKYVLAPMPEWQQSEMMSCPNFFLAATPRVLCHALPAMLAIFSCMHALTSCMWYAKVYRN